MSPDASFRKKTVTGVFWYFLQQFSYYGVQALTTILLAWFLVPEDFGLMAEISVFFSIANLLMDSGISQAIIRKKEVSQIDYSTVFFTNVGLGLLAYIILFATAPFIGTFFGEPMLVILVRVAGLVVVINSFYLVQLIDLTRRLDFRVQFRVTLPAALLSGIVAVAMALLGFGVWSLVGQMITSSVAITALYWIANSWRPTLEFSWDSFYEMFGFGSKLFVSSLIDTVFTNIYVVVIGKLFSATQAGYYFFGQQITTLVISLLSGVVQHVTYPALATLQDDNATLKDSYRKIIQTVVYVVYPCLISLIVLADPLFRLLLKDDWLPAVPYLQLMCVVGLMYPLHAINLNVLKVKGRSDLFLYLEVVKKVIGSVILIISIPYGIIGILVGQIVASVIGYIPNSYFSNVLISYSVREQLRDVIPPLLVATATGLIMYTMGQVFHLEGILGIIVMSGSGFAFYMLANYLLGVQGQPLMIQILKEQWSRKGSQT